MAVRLTAARALAQCDTWDFEEKEFIPFLPDILPNLLGLMTQVEMVESRLRLCTTLSTIIDRVGKAVRLLGIQSGSQFNQNLQVTPFALATLEVLSNVFNQTDPSEGLLKASVVGTIAKLVNVTTFSSHLTILSESIMTGHRRQCGSFPASTLPTGRLLCRFKSGT